MFFSVRDLEVRKAHFAVTLEPGAIEFLDPKLGQSGPLHAEGSVELVEHLTGEIRVRGSLKVEITADCDRCLEPAIFPIGSTFDLTYQPDLEEDGAAEREIDSGEAEIGFYVGEGLELTEVLRECVLLALPMQRVCRPVCRGICPVCGGNRNRESCGCRLEVTDDRWAALKNLTHSLESERK